MYVLNHICTYLFSVLRMCTGDQWRKAVEILYAMRAQGLNPNMITTTLVVDTCERAGRPDVAVSTRFYDIDQYHK